MRVSWGYKIAIFYLSFVIGMVFLVYKANSESFDLVTENYYEAELKYQDVIDQKGNVAELSSPPKITHAINTISIQLPKEFTNTTVEGEIYLYRPSDATKDIRKTFKTVNGFIAFDLGKELSGFYDIKLSWKSGSKQYFDEKKIFF
ncbi:MAG TPA: FixH family protein [Flavisolibacter sp.]